MGSSSSKAARTAGAAARQYPKRPPPSVATQPTADVAPPPPPQQPHPATERSPGPVAKPQPHAATSRSEAVNLDASDPDFAASLRELGPVQPNPTMSPTSAFPHPNNPNAQSQIARAVGPDPRKNPALVVLSARKALQEQAEVEFMDAGRRSFGGRQFLDVFTIRQILVMRDAQGKSAAEIEKALQLKRGVVERLGVEGVVELAREASELGKVDMV